MKFNLEMLKYKKNLKLCDKWKSWNFGYWGGCGD